MTDQLEMGLSREQLLALYRQMLVIRRCEEQLVKLYAAGKIYGGCHTYIGEEAVATGVCAHLRQDDVVFSTHRGHGHALAKGVTPRELIAELLGRATGCSGGRGGSMHLFKPEVGFMGSSGIVGPSITLAAGGGYIGKAAQDRPGQRGLLWRRCGQQRRFPRRDQHGGGLGAAGVVRLREQPVCDRGAVRPGHQESQRGCHALRLRPAGRRGGRQRRAGRVPGGRRGGAPGAVRRRADAAGMQDLPHARPRRRACATPVIAPRKRSRPGRRAARSSSSETAARQRGAATQADLDQIEAEVKALVEEAAAFALNSPLPDPATVTDHVYSPM